MNKNPQYYGKNFLIIFCSSIAYYSFDVFSIKSKPSRRIKGKIKAIMKPTLKLLLKWLETKPTIEGPTEHPRSPARANNANINVPPLLITAEALLKEPGQSIPTENPHIAHPNIHM